jgi:hypothetical protein
MIPPLLVRRGMEDRLGSPLGGGYGDVPEDGVA